LNELFLIGLTSDSSVSASEANGCFRKRRGVFVLMLFEDPRETTYMLVIVSYFDCSRWCGTIRTCVLEASSWERMGFSLDFIVLEIVTQSKYPSPAWALIVSQTVRQSDVGITAQITKAVHSILKSLSLKISNNPFPGYPTLHIQSLNQPNLLTPRHEKHPGSPPHRDIPPPRRSPDCLK